MTAKHYSPAALTKRYAKLDADQRRCDGKHRKCTQRAVADVTTVLRNPETGERQGEPVTRRLCSRHRPMYENSGIYELIESVSLTYAA